MAPPEPDASSVDTLDRVLGFLNFSTGAPDPKFLGDFRDAMARFVQPWLDQPGDPGDYRQVVIAPFRELLRERIVQLQDGNPVFRDVEQSRAVLEIALGPLLDRYRHHHSDLLFHQTDEFLFNSFFLASACQALLRQGPPWEDVDRLISGAIQELNDYLGHRPIATLESRKIEPYSHEYVCPVPMFVQGAGVAEGRYGGLVSGALAILGETDRHLLRSAQFDLAQLKVLAIEPRAFEFDHPINRRPNHHFGQWDESSVGQQGLFERFVIHQVTLEALYGRIERALNAEFPAEGNSIEREARRRELQFESSAALAGTMLMAAGISGSGPNAYDSNTTLGDLLPVIAAYRDEFYQNLLETLPPLHRQRLQDEARVRHQPFGGVRQDLNSELSQRRAEQMVSCRLASVYARMGYHTAAEAQADAVPMASVRIICRIDCLLSAGNALVDRFRDAVLSANGGGSTEPPLSSTPDIGDLELAYAQIPAAFELLQQGIECGAIVDPWNILGFDGQYSLFPALENSVVDHRVFDLVEIVEQILYLGTRLWSEAAATDEVELCRQVRTTFEEIVTWWRQFAAHEVSAVDAVDPDDIFNAAELVATALNLWHKAGAAAGDIAFWYNHAGLFDNPKAFALVIDALMQHRDFRTASELLIYWLNEADAIGLQQGDSSFHDLLFRWITEQRQRLIDAPPEERLPIWDEIQKFHDYLEANAGEYGVVPDFNPGGPDSALPDLGLSHPENGIEDPGSEGLLDDEEDSSEQLFRAAYDEVTYNDSAADGIEGEIFEPGLGQDEDLEFEAERVIDRLEYLGSLASFWFTAADVPLPRLETGKGAEKVQARLQRRQEIFEAWVGQANANRRGLLDLLESIDAYPLPAPGTTSESLVEYDRCRQVKDALLDRAIHTAVETENAIRMLRSNSRALAEMQGASSVQENITGGRTVEAVFAAILRRDREEVVQRFEPMLAYLQQQPLLYVPVAKGGDPAEIVLARVNQATMLDLMSQLPQLGLIEETYRLTRLALVMERENSVGGGAVTEFDQLFQVAYTSIVKCLINTIQHHAGEICPGAEAGSRDSRLECENTLFDGVEKLTESFLIPWLDHSDTLRLTVLEKVFGQDAWNRLVQFIQRYGSGLFTQTFLQVANLRAILHQGVDRWLSQLENAPHRPDLRLLDELDRTLPRKEAVQSLTLILESVIENYSDYRDYNTTTTQSDHGDQLYVLLDFLRLRGKYERVCWKFKPVIWAHEVLVRHQENGVAKMWRRNFREQVAVEADRYLQKLAELRGRYSVQMITVGRRLEERFGHPMQIDRLRALVEPAMRDPASRKSQRVFELLQQETQTFSRSMLGVGMELPAWLAALENEVTQRQLPARLRDRNPLDDWIDPVVLSMAELQDQLDRLAKIDASAPAPPKQ